MADPQEAEYERLVQQLLGSAKLRPDQRDPLRFDVATALMPLIATISKPVFQKLGTELEAALLAALLQATGTPLQRALVDCLIKIYTNGRSYSSQTTFGALEGALLKSSSSTKDATKVGILEAMGSLVSLTHLSPALS